MEAMASSLFTMWALYGLLAALWAGFLWWFLIWWFTPLHWFMMHITMKVEETKYLAGFDSTWVVYVLPMVAVSFLAYIYLKLDRSKLPNRSLPLGKTPSRLARQLVFTNRRFGTMKVGEFLWVLLTVALIVWYFIRSSWKNWRKIDKGITWLAGAVNADHVWQIKFDLISNRFGWLSTMLLFPLFFPVSRSSPLLRATGISFEQASKYHKWIAHAMLWLALLHSVGYWILWVQEGVFWKQIWKWQPLEINNLAGEIDMIVGIVIWLTSLGPVRRKSFETFIWTHQLYMIYLLFLYMHAGDYFVVVMFPSLVLYGIDRLFRSTQALHLVQAEGATIHTDGSVELVIPIAPDFVYRPLDSIYINIPAISVMQWHPFTIASSPLDGRQSLKLIVKPVGWWTLSLQEFVAKEQPILMRVEGPYGQPQDFFAKYDALVLIAGGSGITPFLSMLEDLLHRCGRQQKLPLSVTIVWAVKSSATLQLLQDLRETALYSQYESQVNLKVQIYVTEESSIVGGIDYKSQAQKKMSVAWKSSWPIMPQVAAGRELLSSIIFLFVAGGTFSMMLAFTYRAYDSVPELWARGTVLFLALILGILISCVIVISIWYGVRILKSPFAPASSENSVSEKKSIARDDSAFENPEISYGHRPNFQELFKDLSEKLLVNDIGVLTCGPQGMEHDVAEQCKKHSRGLGVGSGSRVFNFHALSFQL